jgi:hypothetical protein
MISSRTAPWSLLLVGALAGCPSQPPRGCTSSADCPEGEVCVDRRCGPAPDAARPDAPAADTPDAFVERPDAPTFDANCIPVTCAASEVCFDGIDNDCDEVIDEDCPCVPGSATRCLPGRADSSTPRCSWGEMTCEGAGEFGAWGACSGAGMGGETSPYGCRRIGILGAPGANASSNFQAWLEMQGAIVVRIHASPSAPPLRVEELRTFDLVVVDWLQRTYAAEEADTLAGWVREGGGLFVMTGHDSGATANRQVSLLASLGPTYDLRACGACEAGEVCDAGQCVLNGPATLLPSPLTLAEDGTSTLPPVSFFGGLRVRVPDTMAATFTPFATIGGYVVGAAGPVGLGRAVLFGDEWIEFDSEWSTMPSIPRFWQNGVSWCAPDRMVLPACP